MPSRTDDIVPILRAEICLPKHNMRPQRAAPQQQPGCVSSMDSAQHACPCVLFPMIATLCRLIRSH